MKKNVVLTLLSFLALTLASCQLGSKSTPKKKKSSLSSSSLTSGLVSDSEEYEQEDPYDPDEEDPEEPQVDPDDPETPDDPYDPDVPDTPDTPDTPDDPDDPDDPDTPDTPDTPDDPDTPDTPDTPENPDEDPAITQYYANISTTNTGKDLKNELHKLIKISSASVSYAGLYDVYRKSDVRPDGEHFWDIYSDSTDYTLYDSRISANYKIEGDSLNREHIFPQGFFKKSSPMVSDPHHVLPSDGKVNGMRSNYSHGEVTGNVTYTSNDGCKLGTGTGNTTVFEPMNHYKGDIARIYFYFVTSYEDKLSGFDTGNEFKCFARNDFPSLTTTFLELYLKWHLEDPVSEKEVIRNREIYNFQPNRNPFIDRPQYACRIWGGVSSTTQSLCASYNQ